MLLKDCAVFTEFAYLRHSWLNLKSETQGSNTADTVPRGRTLERLSGAQITHMEAWQRG